MLAPLIYCFSTSPYYYCTLSSPQKIPRLFRVFPTEALMLIKPAGIQTGLCVLLGKYCGTTGSLSCACQLYLTYVVTITNA